MPASQRERSVVNRFRLPALLVVLWAATAVIASQPSGPSRSTPAVDSQRSPRSMILREDALGRHKSEDRDPGSDDAPSSDKSRYSATWVLQLWPAVGTAHPAFDETLLDHLEILICRDSDGSACDLVDRLSSAEREIFLRGADGDPEDVGHGESGHYSFDWKSPRSLVGTRLEIRLLVAGLHVDSFDYVPTSGNIGHFRLEINDHPRIRARVLREQGYDAQRLATVLKREFGLGSLEMVHLLSGEHFGAEAMAAVLRDGYGESSEDAAWLLRVNGFGAGDAGEALRDGYGEGPFEVGRILDDLGYACIEIATAVRELFAGDPQAWADVLRTIDCAPDADCRFPDEGCGEDPRAATRVVDSLDAVATLRLPHGDDHGMPDIGFDGSLLDAILVSILDVTGPATTVEARFSASDGPGDIRLKNNFYEADWFPELSHAGKNLEVRFSAAGLDLVSEAFRVSDPRVVHFRFRIDNHPVVRARVLHAAGASATGIVTRLRTEFGIVVADVARILYEEQFAAADLGPALRDGLGAGSAAVAQGLHEGGVPASFALAAIDAAFQLAVVDAISTLRVAGYGASEAWCALEAVLGLEDDEIEAKLRQGGFPEDEILTALAPRLLATYACLIDRSGPKIYFHPNERFLPSSIDWFAGVSPLVWGSGDQECDGCRLAPGAVDSSTLVDMAAQIRSQSPAELDFWFDVPEPEENPAGRAGDLTSARTYVHAVRLRDIGVTDLQFWLFYPYNGPGSMRPSSDLFGLGNVCASGDNFGNVAPLGEHESDWEVVVLRFDDATNQLLEIYLSAHGDYIRYPAQQLEFEEGHVVVYSALNGHAFFPHAGVNAHREKYVDFVVGDFELSTLNWTGTGQSLPAWQRYDFVALDQVFLDAPWLAFDGVWGETVDFNLTYNEKIGIVRAVADDCLLAVRLIHIPIASLALCGLAICPVSCAPAAAFFGIGYGVCYAACVPTCTAATIVGANIAIDPLINAYGPDIVDAAFPVQQGTGKPTPASRGEEWRHFRIPNEQPRIIRISSLGDPAATVRPVVVNIPDRVCEQKSDKWGLGPPVCVDTPKFARVELGIDDEYFDITATSQRVGRETVFHGDWDTTAGGAGTHTLSPRYFDSGGATFEYTRGFEVRPGNADVDLSLRFESSAISEGGTAVLHGEVTPGVAPLEVEVEWADGASDSVSSATDDFVATHAYVDDGVYVVNVTVHAGASVAREAVRLVVANLAPEVGDLTLVPAGPGILDAGTVVEARATFTDPGAADIHTAGWDWGDGLSEAEVDVASPVSALHPYTVPGVHEITLTVSDADLGADEASYRWVVVADPAETAGAGSVLAPVAELGPGEATFALEAFTDDQGKPLVDFVFSIGGVVFEGVKEPVMVYSGNRLEIEGDVSINGVDTAPSGMPYRIRITVTDDPDTLAIKVWFPDEVQGDEVLTLVYETEAGQPLRSGSVSVSEIDGTTGTGSILAPVADDPSLIEQHEATFGFALFADQQSAPAFDFEFQVDGFVLSGVRDPQVTVTGNRLEVVGGVTVGGQESASNGSPYRITVKATDGPDAFQLRVWYLDGSGAEQIFYETEADQALLSGDVRLGAWGTSAKFSRPRNLHDRGILKRAPRSESPSRTR